jgi:hypothetical protein
MGVLLCGLACGACQRGDPSAPPFPAMPPSPAPPSLTTGAKAPTEEADRIARLYAFNVQVVDRPPLPVFLLAHFSEAPGDSCVERLVAHARGLGADTLYVDRDAACAGSAFLVRGASPSPSDANDERRDASMKAESWTAWLHRRWKRPPSVSADESRRLCVVVQFTVSPLRRIWKVNGQPVRSSGNREFDASVLAALESAILRARRRSATDPRLRRRTRRVSRGLHRGRPRGLSLAPTVSTAVAPSNRRGSVRHHSGSVLANAGVTAIRAATAGMIAESSPRRRSTLVTKPR